MSYITTYTGKHFDPVNPDASLLCIEDIAHALSLLCRGNGHVEYDWICSRDAHGVDSARI